MEDMTEMPEYAQNDPQLQQILKEFYNLETPEEIQQRLAEERGEQRVIVREHLIDQLTMARFKKRLTQKQLAQKIGVEQPVISRLESRKTNPKLETILKICEALEVTLVVQYS